MSLDMQTGGLYVQGIGALASAWGNYKIGKEQNDIAKQLLQYEKDKDTAITTKTAEAQKEFEDGFDSVFNPKKKKTTEATDTTTYSDAFSNTSTVTG